MNILWKYKKSTLRCECALPRFIPSKRWETHCGSFISTLRKCLGCYLAKTKPKNYNANKGEKKTDCRGVDKSN